MRRTPGMVGQRYAIAVYVTAAKIIWAILVLLARAVWKLAVRVRILVKR